jgi:hypothetical protein
MGSPLTYYFSRVSLPGATTPYLHLDPHLVWATSDGALGSMAPLEGCGCAASDGWQVCLTAACFYVKLADPSDSAVQSSPFSQTSESIFRARPTLLWVA